MMGEGCFCEVAEVGDPEEPSSLLLADLTLGIEDSGYGTEKDGHLNELSPAQYRSRSRRGGGGGGAGGEAEEAGGGGGGGGGEGGGRGGEEEGGEAAGGGDKQLCFKRLENCSLIVVQTGKYIG